MWTSKIITKIIVNQSELSGCSKSCNDHVFQSILINHEITYDALMKGSGVGGGGLGMQAHTKSFDLLKIMATSLIIRRKMVPSVT